jgi:nucleotide-binding universal stress UspA family protein
MDILIAIDFDTSAADIVKQAIELSASVNNTIHLLHVIVSNKNYGSVVINAMDRKYERPYADDARKKLGEWKQAIKETIPECRVKGYLLEGNIHNAIVQAAKEICPQLIIIGKAARSGFWRYYLPLSADELAKKTKCPVLTVASGNRCKKISTIILPVRDFIPVRKMELLVLFAKIYRATIHLVALQNKMGMQDKERAVLLETYQVLRNGLVNPVEYHLLSGRNLPKAVAAYAQHIGADMLMLNPRTETSISIFLRKHITDALYEMPHLKILSVVPYHER